MVVMVVLIRWTKAEEEVEEIEGQGSFSRLQMTRSDEWRGQRGACLSLCRVCVCVG